MAGETKEPDEKWSGIDIFVIKEPNLPEEEGSACLPEGGIGCVEENWGGA